MCGQIRVSEGEQEELGDAGRWSRTFRPQGAVWVLSLGRQAALAVSSQGEEWPDFNFEIPVGEAGGMFGVDLETGGRGWRGELCRCPSEHGEGGGRGPDQVMPCVDRCQIYFEVGWQALLVI